MPVPEPTPLRDLTKVIPKLDADLLAGRARFVLEAILGHEPSVSELRAFMAGSSYVQEVASMVLPLPGQAVVGTACEAAMSVQAFMIETAEEADRG